MKEWHAFWQEATKTEPDHKKAGAAQTINLGSGQLGAQRNRGWKEDVRSVGGGASWGNAGSGVPEGIAGVGVVRALWASALGRRSGTIWRRLVSGGAATAGGPMCHSS